MKMSVQSICQVGEALWAGEDGVQLTNFSFRTVGAFYDPALPEEPPMLRLQVLHLGRAISVDLDTRVQNLIGQISARIPTCRILQNAWRAAIEAYILDLAAKQSGANATPNALIFRKHGLHRLAGGQWVYICGDMVLGTPQGVTCEIAADVARAHLAWDPEMPAADAAGRLCLRLAQNDSVLLPVWGFTILGSLRSCVSQLNLTTFPSLAIIGGQNLGKTTVAQRFALLYSDNQRPGRCWGQLDARSTAAATIEAISRFRDQVVLVDDLARSAASSETRTRLDLIAEVSRFASNDTERVRLSPHRKPEEQFCQGGLVFTGEFHLNNPSDLTRLTTVELHQPMQNGSSGDRTLAATAFHALILWLLPRLDEELAALRKALDDISFGSDLRLRKNRILFLWSIRLFYQFAAETGAVTAQYVRQAMVRAEEILNEILERQTRKANQFARQSPRGNLCWYIVHAYRENEFHIVSRQNICSDADCVVENDALCIRTDTLLAYLRNATPYRELSKTAMNRRLREEGVLTSHRESRAAAKKIKGQRYLELNLTKLKAASLSY